MMRTSLDRLISTPQRVASTRMSNAGAFARLIAGDDGLEGRFGTAYGTPAPKKRRTLPAKPAVERPAVLTPAEAALYLNIKPATLKSWRAKGVGPTFVKRAARLIGYTPAALDAYLARNDRDKA